MDFSYTELFEQMEKRQQDFIKTIPDYEKDPEYQNYARYREQRNKILKAYYEKLDAENMAKKAAAEEKEKEKREKALLEAEIEREVQNKLKPAVDAALKNILKSWK